MTDAAPTPSFSPVLCRDCEYLSLATVLQRMCDTQCTDIVNIDAHVRVENNGNGHGSRQYRFSATTSALEYFFPILLAHPSLGTLCRVINICFILY